MGKYPTPIHALVGNKPTLVKMTLASGSSWKHSFLANPLQCTSNRNASQHNMAKEQKELVISDAPLTTNPLP